MLYSFLAVTSYIYPLFSRCMLFLAQFVLKEYKFFMHGLIPCSWLQTFFRFNEFAWSSDVIDQIVYRLWSLNSFFRLALDVFCDMELHKFPADKQKCKIVVESCKLYIFNYMFICSVRNIQNCKCLHALYSVQPDI